MKVVTAFANATKMKYIITESQYKLLTEEKENFETFLLKKFPNIDNLKKVYSNTPFTGPVRKYVDPETNNLFFRVVFRLDPKWEPGVGALENDGFIRLYVTPKIYSYVKKYGMNFEYELMNWFNKRYDEDVNAAIKKN